MAKKDVIKKFSSLKGIGKVKAELLYNNGYDSVKKLKEATVEDLIKINGINEKDANLIKDQIGVDLTDKSIDQIEKKSSKQKEIDENEKTDETKMESKEEKDVELPSIDKEIKYISRKKPILTKTKKDKLIIRKQIKKRTPKFLREEWFRYKRIPKNWRKPDGITSKMRINLKYRPNKVRVGFRGPKETRGLHSSGFEEIAVFNIKDIENIDPDKQAARIGSTVGTRKRNEIEKKADELNVRILNRSQYHD
jgi:large subunit ribosomal protein L32e